MNKISVVILSKTRDITVPQLPFNADIKIITDPITTSFAEVRQKYVDPSYDWIVSLDADEQLLNPDILLEYLYDPDIDMVFAKYITEVEGIGSYPMFKVLAFRPQKFRYVGSVHETLVGDGKAIYAKDVIVKHTKTLREFALSQIRNYFLSAQGEEPWKELVNTVGSFSLQDLYKNLDKLKDWSEKYAICDKRHYGENRGAYYLTHDKYPDEYCVFDPQNLIPRINQVANYVPVHDPYYPYYILQREEDVEKYFNENPEDVFIHKIFLYVTGRAPDLLTLSYLKGLIRTQGEKAVWAFFTSSF